LNNFLNSNDIFPIIEIIRREVRKNDFDRARVFNVGENTQQLGRADDVVSVEILRGSSSYDPELISAIITTYADNSVETLNLYRGITPPVPPTVPDHEFINNVLISGFEINVSSAVGGQTVICQIDRENGYGKVEKLNFTYAN
jgi:hypothetical protein